MKINNAKTLVQKTIIGTRKGSNIPSFLHSFRVAELLKKFWFSEKIQIAGLLHDVIEDWGQSEESLSKLWYDGEIIELVKLCSHDKKIVWSFERRQAMILQLINADNTEARAIKLADITDNLTECHLMERAKLERFLFKKAPVFMYYWNKYFWWTEFYSNFIDTYFQQLKKYNNYNF